jgi:glutathione synthase/RimK-type ligase-like ATP-grasp enzyme
MSEYIWYSGATDITGKALAEALECEGGRNKPSNKDIIIGWGTKTDRDVDLGRAKVLNHPNVIKLNRNKLSTLNLLYSDRNLKPSISPYFMANDISAAIRSQGQNIFPLIGRSKYHQGGKGLWLCLTKDHVEQAKTAGAEYFQKYIDIKTEYRLHIFGENIIYAQKKVENPSIEGWTNQKKEKINDYAEKNNATLDGTTVDFVISIFAKEAVLPDRIVRSNKRGWKFSSVALSSLPSSLKDVAIKSLKCIGLDFGAVDCAIDNSNTPFIIEVNTGPGLQGTSFSKYVEAFRNAIAEFQRPEPSLTSSSRSRTTSRPRTQQAAMTSNENNEISNGGLATVMRNVRNDDEARAIIDELMSRRR